MWLVPPQGRLAVWHCPASSLREARGRRRLCWNCGDPAIMSLNIAGCRQKLGLWGLAAEQSGCPVCSNSRALVQVGPGRPLPWPWPPLSVRGRAHLRKPASQRWAHCDFRPHEQSAGQKSLPGFWAIEYLNRVHHPALTLSRLRKCQRQNSCLLPAWIPVLPLHCSRRHLASGLFHARKL